MAPKSRRDAASPKPKPKPKRGSKSRSPGPVSGETLEHATSEGNRTETSIAKPDLVSDVAIAKDLVISGFNVLNKDTSATPKETSAEPAHTFSHFVLFYHDCNPDLWINICKGLRSFIAQCTSFSEVEDIVQGIEGIRSLSGYDRDKAPLKSLKKVIESIESSKICSFATFKGPVLAVMATLVEELPSLFPVGLPVLTQHLMDRVLLTRKQCAALLAAAFFKALPPDDEQQKRSRLGPRLSLPSFSLSGLLRREEEKLSCLLNYFHVITMASPEFLHQVVSFARRVEQPLPDCFWQDLDKPLAPIREETGNIEEVEGCLQADFANKFLGGGALAGGTLQEEIRFATCPECYVGMLFCESMLDNEVIFIVGTCQYSDYIGYGHSFRFSGPRKDIEDRPHDELNRCGSHIVAFDAQRYLMADQQYEQPCIERELLKAYAACHGDLDEDSGPRQVGFATGNWGCGAFGGDPQLKVLIQWLAASATDRELVYFPFGDERLSSLGAIIRVVQTSGIRCSELYRLLSGHAPQKVFDNLSKSLL